MSLRGRLAAAARSASRAALVLALAALPVGPAVPAPAAPAAPTATPTPSGTAPDETSPPARLVGFARLPAAPRDAGPASGRALEPTNGVDPPFPGRPHQGVSAVLPGDRPGVWLGLLDNGYGSRANSPDAVLRWLELRPRFRTVRGGPGTVDVGGLVDLRDPDRHLPAVVADGAVYPGGDDPVEPALRRHRSLTGADLDPESFARAADGVVWIGDEFGPWLLPFGAGGRLLGPGVSLPGVRAPEHPETAALGATLPRSRGFEGLAATPDGRRLYALLEGSVAGDPPGVLRLQAFDPVARRWVVDAAGAVVAWRYRLETPEHAIGELVALDARRFLVIERDGRDGDEARFKRIYAVDLDAAGDDGTLAKTLVVDLLAIEDPDDLDRDGRTTFRFPFQTIEAAWPVDDRTLLVVNDSNWPFGDARRRGVPDDTEFVLLRVAVPLGVDARR